MDEQDTKTMLEQMKKDKEGPQRKFWSPPSKKEGTFPIRFLPPLKQKKEVKFYFTHRTHWIDGIAYECINQTLVDKEGNEHSAEDCPLCAYARKLYAISERDTAEWRMANSINAKTRYIYRVVVRNSDDETVPVFFESGTKIFDNLYNILTETDYGNIIDPKRGRDFNIVKVGTGRRSNYDQSLPGAKESSIFKDAEDLKKMLKNALEMDYNSLVEFKSYETLDRALKESLGVGVKPSASEEDRKYPDNDVEEKYQEEESADIDEDSDEIDDILSEFAN